MMTVFFIGRVLFGGYFVYSGFNHFKNHAGLTGYAQMKKLAEAGKAYEDAAKATSFETERSFQLAKAARVYQAAGNTAKAKEIWTALLNDPKSQTMSAEARVRLGELSAQTAKR